MYGKGAKLIIIIRKQNIKQKQMKMKSKHFLLILIPQKNPKNIKIVVIKKHNTSRIFI